MRTGIGPLHPSLGASAGRQPIVVEARGRGREAGRAHGEACRDLIRRHLDHALERLSHRAKLGEAAAIERALPYRQATASAYPELVAEVDGVGEGASLPQHAAWVLQLRAELQRDPVPSGAECTSFAAFSGATPHGGTIAGLNVDLPSFYQDILVVIRQGGNGTPRITQVVPAGQVGHHGMNEWGVTVLANFLSSEGWRVGVPRYFLTRIALAERSRAAALAAVEAAPRASPRNMMIADMSGATDIELASDAAARIEASEGLVAHTNHHVAATMIAREAANAHLMRNSRTRLARVESLLRDASGSIDVAAAAEILRDRANLPDAICSLRGEWPDDEATVASTIADVTERRLWIAIGPPDRSSYYPYEVAA